jgi:hypothetical protein
MIASLNSGPGVIVTGGNSGPYVDMNRPSAGMVRYNGNTMEVYDGHNWMSVSTHASVQLDPDVQRILDWAQKKMLEEQALCVRMARHPGLKEAYERFKVMDTLTLEESTT